MSDAPAVLRADDPRRSDLESLGWSVSARSWGAALDALRVDVGRFTALVERVGALASVRELGPADAPAALALDAATVGDYPGSVATRHEPLSAARAIPSASRRAFGAFTPAGELVAVTFVDVGGENAETDFTCVARARRGSGLATAVKAASVIALLGSGVRGFRTGGSADNQAILAANTALGYLIDEEWVTLQAP